MTARTALPLLLPWLLSCATAPPAPPATAVLILLDKSGSMAGDGFADLKRACLTASKELGAADYIGVVAFDVRPRWVVPLMHPDDAKISGLVGKLLADGGSYLLPALEESRRAFRTLPKDPPLRKRLVIVSDGNTREGDYHKVVQELAQEGVSVSTLCLSTGQFDAVLMSQLATWGRGRFKFTNKASHVPLLLAQETHQFKAE